jgi:hypothetical protein
MKSRLCSIITFLFLCLYVTAANAQDTITVTGIVTSFKKYPLNKARIVAEGRATAIYTDSAGRFAIDCSPKEVLKISASGFKSRSVKTGKQTVYQVDLLFENKPGDFGAAVSGGHISEKTLQFAIDEEIKKNARDYSKYNSIYELISSEVYSVTVKGTAVYNKAVRSMDSNPQVLYDVDGKITSDISYISPVYVKSIEFIDDVGATMYGSRGANGVLKITLKSRQN